MCFYHFLDIISKGGHDTCLPEYTIGSRTIGRILLICGVGMAKTRHVEEAQEVA